MSVTVQQTAIAVTPSPPEVVTVSENVVCLSITEADLAIEVRPANAIQVALQAPTVSVAIGGVNVSMAQQPTITVAGIQGPAGTAGESQTITVTAPADMSAHRVIAYCTGDYRLEYAGHEHVQHAGKVLGVTITAALAGDPIIIRLGGEIEEPGWSWTPGLVFVGSEGQMTQTPPTSGFLQAVGVAITPTLLVVNPLNPVLL